LFARLRKVIAPAAYNAKHQFRNPLLFHILFKPFHACLFFQSYVAAGRRASVNSAVAPVNNLLFSCEVFCAFLTGCKTA
jgi:hypothetical protein